LDRTLIGPDGKRYICVSKMVRNQQSGIVPMDTELPSMICDEYGKCSPCDEVAVIRQIDPAD
jgi:hypothetical protein